MLAWEWSVERLLDGLLDWIATQLIDILDKLWALLSGAFLVVPQVSALPQVQSLSASSLMVVNASFVVVVMICGIVVMTRETVQVRYGIGEVAPRLVLGFVAANFAAPISEFAITITNALRVALTGDGITTEGSLGQMRAMVTGAMTDPGAGLLVLIIAVIVAVLVAMLWVGWIVRLGVLVILVGVAPVALACHSTVWTEPAAKLWWRTLLAVLGTVILQALALHTAFSVFLDPQANLPLLGIPVADGQAVLVNLMIVTVLLWATVKIPALMRRYVTGGQSTNVVAAVMRIAVVQQLGRVLSAGRRAPTRRLPPRPTGPTGPRRGGPAPGPRPPGPRPTRGPRPAPGPRPTPPAGGGGPQPGQPPPFSHAPARHRPLPRPARTAAAATAVPHRQPAATPVTPLPAPVGGPRPAGFSHTTPPLSRSRPAVRPPGPPAGSSTRRSRP